MSSVKPCIIVYALPKNITFRNLIQASDGPAEDKTVVEVGCGSGAISLALVHSLPGLRVTCLDQSKMACDLTMENARNLNLVREHP